MRYTIVALALSATSYAWKFGVTSGNTPVQYLKIDGTGTANINEAAECEIVADALKCDGLGMPAYPFIGDMVQLKPIKGAGSTGWSRSGDVIQWANKDRAFSLRGDPPKAEIWAENCPHGHFPVHGKAKAYTSPNVTATTDAIIT